MALKTLSGKTCLVTGSTSGIGLGIASALAGAGANVILNGFGEASAIEKLRLELAAQAEVEVRYSNANMSRPGEIHEMIRQYTDEFGGIDILVNNAGVQHVAPIESFPWEQWDAILAINLSSAFHAIQAVLPAMKKRGWGRIINLASVHGLVASPFKSAYVAAKHGLVGLTKTVALELAETPITCNAICPGYVLTPLVEKQVAEQAAAHHLSEQNVIRDVMLASQPTKRFIATEHIAQLALFLTSSAAASMTGSIIPLDGGWTAR